MGRKADSAALQAAKGNPGRRKPQAKSATATALIGPIAPPDWMTYRDFRAALAVWSRLAPVLAKLNVLTPTDVDAFARYCQHMADWIRLTKRIRVDGETQKVETTTGDKMIRIHPALKAREIAERRVLELEDRFGLSPSHRLSIYRDMSAMNMSLGSLFDQPAKGEIAPETDEPAVSTTTEDDDIIGFGQRHGAPIGSRPN